MPIPNAAKFLMGASCLAVACATPALAGTYHVTDNASLRTATNDANADPDPSATIILDNDVVVSGGTWVAPAKPITIDAGSHTLTSGYNSGSSIIGAVNLNGGGNYPAGGRYIFNGAIQAQSAGAGASGTGDQGIFMNVGKTVTNNGAITGGAGGGLGGAGGNGVGITGVSSFTNTGSVTGGSAVNGSGGNGMFLSSGPTLNNSGTIRGGDGLTGGIGVFGNNIQLISVTNSGTIQGGNGTTGSGGDGLRFSPGNRSLTNDGTIQGGNGAFGGAGVNITGTAAAPATFVNRGTIRGGNGGGTGVGISVHASVGTITNTGTIAGGDGAYAITNVLTAPVSLINSGTIAAGAGQDTAILMQSSSNLTLELRKGSVITGKVAGNTGAATNSLILGGDDNAGFDVSQIGPQYQNFTSYQKTGNSVWTLTGTGSVATPWTIGQGTLAIGDGASVIGDVADNAALAFGNNNTLTFANVITGTGSVNQTGSGRTNLTGASTYSGPTTVSGGTLAVNGSIASAVTVASGGTLGGNGTVGATTVQSGGNIAPGNSIGTLHVSGAFVANAGSIYTLEADPNSHASDLILVNGSATILSGAKLNLVANPSGTFQAGAHYTILTASGGVSGAYDSPAPISQYLGFRETQDANNLYLDVIQTGDPAGAAQTPNQQAAAGGVPAGGGIETGLLNSPSATDAAGAFDKLSGEAMASARGALVSGSLLVRDTALDRLRDICASSEMASHPGCPDRGRPLVWSQGFGNWGRLGGNANAAAVSHSTGGFLIGTDVPVHDWRLGFFGGYSRTDFHVDARNSWGSSDNYHLGAYGGTSMDGVAVRLGASYSWNDLSTERDVAFGNFADHLTANYNAGTAQVFGEVGQSFTFDRLNLEPIANLSYVNLRTTAFREGGGEAALSGAAGTQEDTFATLGLRPSTDFSIWSLPLRLKGMAGWRHTFGTVTPSAAVAFAGGNAFTVSGAPIARDAGVVEAGLSANLTGRAAVNLTYGAEFGGTESNNGIRGTLAIAF
jgi:outer membrane autotransporter protein